MKSTVTESGNPARLLETKVSFLMLYKLIIHARAERWKRQRRGSFHLKISQWLLIDTRQILQLDKIHTALTRFKFRHKRLGLGKSPRDFHLSQVCVFAGLFQTPKECSIVTEILTALQG